MSGRGDRLRAVQHPDKRSHVPRVRKGERLEDASCLGEGGEVKVQDACKGLGEKLLMKKWKPRRGVMECSW